MNLFKVFLIGIICSIAFISVSCKNGNNLDGTWHQYEENFIEFKGKNFVKTSFDGGISAYGENPAIKIITISKGTYSFSNDGKKIEFVYSSVLVYYNDELTREETRDIDVYTFERTENTITINENQYTRK